MKIKYVLLSAFTMLLTATSCDKNFDKINVDPNAIVDVTPDLLLPTVIRGTVNTMVGEGWSIGNIVVQHTAKIQFVNEDRYIWGDRSGIWNAMYGNLRDVNNLYLSSEERGFNNYKGVALILKSWAFSILTDTYGDVPYAQALQGKTGGILNPEYDAQENIYNGILADLNTANELLGSTEEEVGGDILFGGNISSWKKLANSLSLRYLMRISNKRDVSVPMRAIVNDHITYPLMGEGESAALEYLPDAPNQFPLHTYRVGSFDEFRLSKNLGDKLLAFGDPRIRVFARPTAATANTPNPVYVGVPNGLNDVDALGYNGGVQNVSRIGSVFFEDAITSRGRRIARGYIMGYPELQFILAEAAQKGLIDGSAKDYYEKGITASFASFDTEMPADYLIRTGVVFEESTALERIGTQKWISLFFAGLEAWFDWRRTGYPQIIPGPSNQNNGQVPARYAYPLSEQSLNGANREAAVSRQGADNYNTKVWWDQ